MAELLLRKRSDNEDIHHFIQPVTEQANSLSVMRSFGKTSPRRKQQHCHCLSRTNSIKSAKQWMKMPIAARHSRISCQQVCRYARSTPAFSTTTPPIDQSSDCEIAERTAGWEHQHRHQASAPVRVSRWQRQRPHPEHSRESGEQRKDNGKGSPCASKSWNTARLCMLVSC